ncbi:MAG: riboflavin synthase [Chloroflexi bacterium]|nr:riboflavin synthase [Chloroflexota bacterium]|tara:strand:- start:4486 stop:5070 length:585 start_codon:yes stop_codon:yes gene_type:complete
MFTGIIEEIGTVLSHDIGELILECPLVTSDANLGDSIAVNGVDLTVRSVGESSLSFDVMNETYSRSNLQNLIKGNLVNLERSVTTGTKLSGHIVRGVVETTCEVTQFKDDNESVIASYEVESEYLKYIVMKGPVCLDGVSLTVMERDENSFSVSLVQYTQENTNLTRRNIGDHVNLETDIFARYVEQILENREN